MSKCRYCHKFIYPWQSYFTKPAIEYEEYAILINPEYDRYMHEGCYFNFL